MFRVTGFRKLHLPATVHDFYSLLERLLKCLRQTKARKPTSMDSMPTACLHSGLSNSRIRTDPITNTPSHAHHAPNSALRKLIDSSLPRYLMKFCEARIRRPAYPMSSCVSSGTESSTIARVYGLYLADGFDARCSENESPRVEAYHSGSCSVGFTAQLRAVLLITLTTFADACDRPGGALVM